MPIRLFTEGTHNGLTFAAKDIKTIHERSVTQGNIPFVFGHPKNNLPIVGYVAGSDLHLYEEEGKKSIGFDRGNAEFSEESLQAIRKLGNNKISVRLVESVINHIGLVEKAAVSANNQQDFADSISGDFAAVDDFQKPQTVFNKINQFIKPKQTMSETNLVQVLQENVKLKKQLAESKKKEADEKQKADFALVKSEKEKLQEELNAMKYKDFEQKIDAFKLPKEEAYEAKAFGKAFVDMGKQDELLGFIENLSKRASVTSGSVVADFLDEGTKLSVEEQSERELTKQFEQIK